MNIPQKPWKSIAWNGIRFECPMDWEIDMIGNRYLMLETDGKPVFEIKWGHTRGAFSPRKTLRLLAKNQARQMALSVKECSLPPQWKKPLDTYETTGFLWQGQCCEGKGVMLYCPVCRNATLIQFYSNAALESGNLPERLLASFQDHPAGSRVEWKVFDIKAKIPEPFELMRYRFNSGAFEMAFASDGQKITLYRFGPASTLLRQNSLAEFAAKVTGHSHVTNGRIIEGGHQAVEGEIRKPKGLKWRRLIKRQPAVQWVGFWHVEKKNRILGIKTEGERPFPADLLKQICSDYEIV